MNKSKSQERERCKAVKTIKKTKFVVFWWFDQHKLESTRIEFEPPPKNFTTFWVILLADNKQSEHITSLGEDNEQFNVS